MTEMNGWREITYPNTSSSFSITRDVPLNGLTILDCQPQTNDPSHTFVSWLRDSMSISESDPNHVRLNSWTLMVRNFSPPKDHKFVHYECIVAGYEYLRGEQRRTFNLTVREGKAHWRCK